MPKTRRRKTDERKIKVAQRIICAPLHPEAKSVQIVRGHIGVTLRDGRSLFVPTIWYPDVHNLSPAQQANTELIGGGVCIFWPDADLYVSVRRLLVPDGDC